MPPKRGRKGKGKGRVAKKPSSGEITREQAVKMVGKLNVRLSAGVLDLESSIFLDDDAAAIVKQGLNFFQTVRRNDKPITLPNAFLEKLVNCIERQSICSLVHGELFVLIFEALLLCKDNERKRRGVYLLTLVLNNPTSEKEQAISDMNKILAGKELLCRLLSMFTTEYQEAALEDGHHVMFRRLIGILLVNLMSDCEQNLQLLRLVPEDLRRRVGFTIFAEKDLIIRIITGRFINCILELDGSYPLADLWPQEETREIFDSFPSPGLSEKEWNNQYQAWIDFHLAKDESGDEPMEPLYFARTVLTLPNIFATNHRPTCLFIYQDMITIYAQPRDDEIEELLDIPMINVLSVSFLEPDQASQSSQDSRGVVLRIETVEGNCLLNSRPETMLELRFTSDELVEGRQLMEVIRNTLPKYQGRVLSCTTPIRNSQLSEGEDSSEEAIPLASNPLPVTSRPRMPNRDSPQDIAYRSVSGDSHRSYKSRGQSQENDFSRSRDGQAFMQDQVQINQNQSSQVFKYVTNTKTPGGIGLENSSWSARHNKATGIRSIRRKIPSPWRDQTIAGVISEEAGLITVVETKTTSAFEFPSQTQVTKARLDEIVEPATRIPIVPSTKHQFEIYETQMKPSTPSPLADMDELEQFKLREMTTSISRSSSKKLFLHDPPHRETDLKDQWPSSDIAAENEVSLKETVPTKVFRKYGQKKKPAPQARKALLKVKQPLGKIKDLTLRRPIQVDEQDLVKTPSETKTSLGTRPSSKLRRLPKAKNKSTLESLPNSETQHAHLLSHNLQVDEWAVQDPEENLRNPHKALMPLKAKHKSKLAAKTTKQIHSKSKVTASSKTAAESAKSAFQPTRKSERSAAKAANLRMALLHSGPRENFDLSQESVRVLDSYVLPAVDIVYDTYHKPEEDVDIDEVLQRDAEELGFGGLLPGNMILQQSPQQLESKRAYVKSMMAEKLNITLELAGIGAGPGVHHEVAAQLEPIDEPRTEMPHVISSGAGFAVNTREDAAQASSSVMPRYHGLKEAEHAMDNAQDLDSNTLLLPKQLERGPAESDLVSSPKKRKFQDSIVDAASKRHWSAPKKQPKKRQLEEPRGGASSIATMPRNENAPSPSIAHAHAIPPQELLRHILVDDARARKTQIIGFDSSGPRNQGKLQKTNPSSGREIEPKMTPPVAIVNKAPVTHVNEASLPGDRRRLRPQETTPLRNSTAIATPLGLEDYDGPHEVYVDSLVEPLVTFSDSHSVDGYGIDSQGHTYRRSQRVDPEDTMSVQTARFMEQAALNDTRDGMYTKIMDQVSRTFRPSFVPLSKPTTDGIKDLQVLSVIAEPSTLRHVTSRKSPKRLKHCVIEDPARRQSAVVDTKTKFRASNARKASSQKSRVTEEGSPLQSESARMVEVLEKPTIPSFREPDIAPVVVEVSKRVTARKTFGFIDHNPSVFSTPDCQLQLPSKLPFLGNGFASNRKQRPASPHDQRALGRRYQLVKDGSYVNFQDQMISVEVLPSHISLKDPFENKMDHAPCNQFAKRLRNAATGKQAEYPQQAPILKRSRNTFEADAVNNSPLPAKRKVIYKLEDDEKTLVEPHSQLQQDGYESDSDDTDDSHASSGSGDVHEDIKSQSDNENVDDAWSRALEPSRQGVAQAMMMMTNNLLRILLSKEAAIVNVVEDYERGGERLTEELDQQQRSHNKIRYRAMKMRATATKQKTLSLSHETAQLAEQFRTAFTRKREKEWSDRQKGLLKSLQMAREALTV